MSTSPPRKLKPRAIVILYSPSQQQSIGDQVMRLMAHSSHRSLATRLGLTLHQCGNPGIPPPLALFPPICPALPLPHIGCPQHPHIVSAASILPDCPAVHVPRSSPSIAGAHAALGCRVGFRLAGAMEQQQQQQQQQNAQFHHPQGSHGPHDSALSVGSSKGDDAERIRELEEEVRALAERASAACTSPLSTHLRCSY